MLFLLIGLGLGYFIAYLQFKDLKQDKKVLEERLEDCKKLIDKKSKEVEQWRHRFFEKEDECDQLRCDYNQLKNK